MTHVMLDLETWGTLPGSDLRSIGAVVFDFENGADLTKTFYANTAYGADWGLKRDPSTIMWWSQQSQAAQDALEVDQVGLSKALHEFSEWFASVGGTTIWAHGPVFDVVLIEVAYRACGLPIPWTYKAPRDTRTVYEFFPMQEVPRVGTEHNALDDAIYQVNSIVHAFQKPLRHDFWAAGDPDCPADLKAWNGELHTLRCKRCGASSSRDQICRPHLWTKDTPA